MDNMIVSEMYALAKEWQQQPYIIPDVFLVLSRFYPLTQSRERHRYYLYAKNSDISFYFSFFSIWMVFCVIVEKRLYSSLTLAPANFLYWVTSNRAFHLESATRSECNVTDCIHQRWSVYCACKRRLIHSELKPNTICICRWCEFYVHQVYFISIFHDDFGDNRRYICKAQWKKRDTLVTMRWGWTQSKSQKCIIKTMITMIKL